MKLSISTGLILAVSAFSGIASAIEVIYLLDCEQIQRDGINTLTRESKMAYYANMDDSRHGEIPPYANTAQLERGTPGDLYGLVKWEVWEDLPDNSQEDYVQGRFRGDGNHVKAYINKQAKDWPTYTVVGNAVNDGGKWFTCRKDREDRIQYVYAITGYQETCRSRYACTA
ncbi:hypothetical protein HDU97_003759 [Phlyctochytrium planicorne]|nr:hypothetical protein HDU97_003759 [Phlyctochytrium planicorne]